MLNCLRCTGTNPATGHLHLHGQLVINEIIVRLLRGVQQRRFGMATCTAAGPVVALNRSRSTAVIVHPEYQHTLPVEPVKVSFWECCDDHVLVNIARSLGDVQSLVNLQLVNKRCRHVANDEQLWRHLCIRQFNCTPDFSESKFSWRELYKFNHEALRYLLAQTATEALMKLGIRATNNNYVLMMQGLTA